MAEDGKEMILQLPHFPRVKIHMRCEEEINGLIQESETDLFIADYEVKIKFLSEHMGQETVHKWFEQLKKAQGLRSIHMVKFHNMRILYMLEKGVAYLLLAFEEKQGHGNTEYRKFIPAALERLNEKGSFV